MRCGVLRQGKAKRGWMLGVSVLLFQGVLGATDYFPSTAKPPAPYREFRGLWVATVKNIDWPSQPGLPARRQQAELLAILDQAVRLKLNAVLLQVRPSCDAFYESNLEPWSEYLTGRMGQPPQPRYDPLAFAVAEAHKRGLELHAWFNPYRARHPSATGPVSGRHISKTKPHWVRQYGPYEWLDPGEKAVEDHAVNVILDVVRRYDIDGVHLDDYFYPYPEKTAAGGLISFPDEETYRRYRKAGGKLDLADWRRNNVNRLVHRLSQGIKSEKPWVKFGVSPFGIWRSGNPPPVKGLSAVDTIYADSRQWLQAGWVDYLGPQLYWSTQAKEQGFGDLLQWWSDQNRSGRHLWIGVSLTEPRATAARSSTEVLKQIALTRQKTSVAGVIFWHAKLLMEDRNGVATALASQAFAQPALVPASPWLKATPPKPPQATVQTLPGGTVRVDWAAAGREPVWLWLLQMRSNDFWTTRILPSSTHGFLLEQPMPELIALTAVNRIGMTSPSTTLRKAGTKN
jgi:uncharacterized lipoprotein YddW (UPF0748 family)